MSAKEEILSRITSALRDAPAPGPVPASTACPRTCRRPS